MFLCPVFNPFTVFTAPGCKISHGHPCIQSIFWLCITSTFTAMRFDENPFTRQCKKEKRKRKKKAKGLRISHF